MTFQVHRHLSHYSRGPSLRGNLLISLLVATPILIKYVIDVKIVSRGSRDILYHPDMHPQTHTLIQIEGFSLSASSQVTLSFKPRLLRISTPGQVYRPFHSLLTSRVSRRYYGLSPFRPICHISAEFSTCFYHITHYVSLGTQLSVRLLYRLGASI